MTYTNAWSNTYPAGTDAANGAAADLRRIRLDVQERMDTLLGAGGWVADPIVAYVANVTKFIHWSDFILMSGGNVTAWTATAPSQYGLTYGAGATTATFYAPIIIPRGVTVTEIAVLGQTAASSSLVLTLEAIDATTATVTQATLATATMAASTQQSAASSGTVSVAINSTAATYKYYYLKLVDTMSAASTTWFQGVRIVYTRANIGQTI